MLSYLRLSCLVAILLALSSVGYAQGTNQLKSIDVQEGQEGRIVKITTATPVGYRYTVYDSFDPVRVVIDFPGMDTAEVKTVNASGKDPIQEVRVSSFDLESGKLGRVEILLSQSAPYDVSLSGNDFEVKFAAAESAAVPTLGAKLKKTQPAPAEPVETVAAQVAEAPPAEEKPAPVAEQPAPVVEQMAAVEEKPAPAPAPAAVEKVEPKVASSGQSTIATPQLSPGKVVLPTSGMLDGYKYFALENPSRLVVDLYGAVPDFSQRSFPADKGMRSLRVGTYDDKTRFVFDAEAGKLPDYTVSKSMDDVIVSWAASSDGMPTEAPAVEKAAAPKPAPAPAKPVAVTASPATIVALTFDSENGVSKFVIELSKASELIPAEKTGNIIRFGVKNVLLAQSQRRTIDASAFPSAVRLITPYTVQSGRTQEVRFAVELKGDASYRLNAQGSQVVMSVQDGSFAEQRIGSVDQEKLPLPAAESAPSASKAAPSVPSGPADQVLESTAVAVSGEGSMGSAAKTADATAAGAGDVVRVTENAETKYTGEKISLVFDNADIRKILQLIGEVSELNIIASDDVNGTITLRLLDVPWDQALDLILDIKDLGMLRQGNVARIMPRDRMREIEENKLSARRNKEKLEDLVTEVIPVSHADLTGITKPAQELLSERGKITPDPRNKQIIVTDIPSTIADVRNLVNILDTPEKQVLIEARIVEANSNFARDLGVKWGFDLPQNDNNRLGLDQAGIGLGGSFLISPTSVANLSGSGIGSSFTFGRLGSDNATLDLKISALETSGHGKVVSTPRIATLNGEAATISQGTKIPYQSVGDNGTETKFENAELKLEVTPVINPDGSIILEINAANSSVGATVPTGVGTAIAIDEKKAETKVLIRDGETTVIGGIFVEDERNSESGVPLLMHIPILGHLFKSTTTTAERRELLIFITPRILQ